MILTLTFLVVAFLQPAQPTIVTTFEPEQPTVIATFEQPELQGIALEPAQLTIVKTWTITK